MGRILVIRHPETQANLEHRYVSDTDSPWTETGRSQAKTLAALVQGVNPEVVWSSPAPRALKAAHVATPCSVPLRIVEELREIRFGAAEGLTFDETRSVGIEVRYLPFVPGRLTSSSPELKGAIAPGGERWADFLHRVRVVRDALIALDRTVCVFTHGGTGRALVASLLELPPEAMWAFALPTGGVAEIITDAGRSTLVRLFRPSGAD